MTADAAFLFPAFRHKDSRTDGVSRPFYLCKIEKREGK